MPMLGKTGDKAEDTAGGDAFHGQLPHLCDYSVSHTTICKQLELIER